MVIIHETFPLDFYLKPTVKYVQRLFNNTILKSQKKKNNKKMQSLFEVGLHGTDWP